MVITIDEDTKSEVGRILSKVKNEVKLHFFFSEDCTYCKDEEEILKILTELNPLIKVMKYPDGLNHEKAKALKIDKIPALVIHGVKEYKIRYFGIPAGYEFGSLIEDIVDAARGEVDLEERARRLLNSVDEEVHIQVFVTPSCPYCPSMVRASHKFAIVNERITSDAIEAMEFNELADKYEVYTVPKVVINDRLAFEGTLPETYFAAAILKALGKPLPEAELEEALRGVSFSKLD